MYIYTHTYTHISIHNNNEVLTTITVFVSAADHIVILAIFNYLLPLHIPCSVCHGQAPQLVMVHSLVGWMT